MTRGTTPDIIATICGAELTDLASLHVTIQQDDVTVTKTLDDVVIDGQDVHVSLTQEETLQFAANSTALIQVRGLTNDGTAFATNIKQIVVLPLLEEGVIDADNNA